MTSSDGNTQPVRHDARRVLLGLIGVMLFVGVSLVLWLGWMYGQSRTFKEHIEGYHQSVSARASQIENEMLEIAGAGRTRVARGGEPVVSDQPLLRRNDVEEYLYLANEHALDIAERQNRFAEAEFDLTTERLYDHIAKVREAAGVWAAGNAAAISELRAQARHAAITASQLGRLHNVAQEAHIEQQTALEAGAYRNFLILLVATVSFGGFLVTMLYRSINTILVEQRESEKKYSTLAHLSPVGIFHANAEGHCTYINEQWAAITGIESDEALGEDCLMAVHPEDRQRVSEAWERAIEQKSDFAAEYRFVAAAGNESWVIGQASPEFNKRGEIVGFVGTVTDITDRKKAEEAVKTEGKRLVNILDSLNSTVGIFETDGQLVQMHQRSPADRAVTARPEDFSGMPLWETYWFSHSSSTQETLRDGLLRAAGGETVRFDTKVRIAEDTFSWADFTFSPLYDADGAIVNVIGSAIDITDRKAAEEELEKHRGRLEELVVERTRELAELHEELVDASHRAGMAEVATGVLHNVGNVLNSVNVSAGLVTDRARRSRSAKLKDVVALLREHKHDLAKFLDSDPQGKSIVEYLEKLSAHLGDEQRESVEELESLTRNIGHIKDVISTQQSYAQMSGVTETVSLAVLLDDALSINTEAMDRHRVKVHREYDDINPISVEKHKVLQILINLISNAKYELARVPDGERHLTLSIAARNGNAVIEVRDTGPGIPEENLTKIFAHGFTTRAEGHGFGLHLSAIAAQEMGGSLAAHNNAGEPGAAFSLNLPYTHKTERRKN